MREQGFELRPDSTITIIDCTSNKVTGSLIAGGQPNALCISSACDKLYCANRLTSTVSVIDLATGKTLATVETGQRPMALCYNSHSGNVYCPNIAEGTVTRD